MQAFELDPDRLDIAMALGIIHFNQTGKYEKVLSSSRVAVQSINNSMQAVPYLMEVLRAKDQEPQRTYMAHITLANIALVADPEHNV